MALWALVARLSPDASQTWRSIWLLRPAALMVGRQIVDKHPKATRRNYASHILVVRDGTASSSAGLALDPNGGN